jgi:hypothetical protein
MEYTIDELNIPDIYSTDDINKFKNYESNIDELVITLRPYETYYKWYDIHTSIYAYLITNNTKLYMLLNCKDSKMYEDVCEGHIYKRNIYNKMYLCIDCRIMIKNYSDEMAYLKIFVVQHIPTFITFSNYSYMQFNGETRICCDYTGKIYGMVTENIMIKTNEKINITYNYFDTPNMLLCYKIKNVRDDIYELKLCKITNKINNKSIIIPQKNINNIVKYYRIIHDKLSGIFSECTTDTIYRVSLFDACKIINFQSIYFDVFHY